MSDEPNPAGEGTSFAATDEDAAQHAARLEAQMRLAGKDSRARRPPQPLPKSGSPSKPGRG